jgi:membrane protein implicated in regulation of membrane protease activity
MAAATWKKYTLFQVPGWLGAAIVLLGLVQWFNLSAWAASGLFALWVIKDIRSIRSFDPHTSPTSRPGWNSLSVKTEWLQERFDPYGIVRVRGELWQAAAEPTEQPIEPNMK